MCLALDFTSAMSLPRDRPGPALKERSVSWISRAVKRQEQQNVKCRRRKYRQLIWDRWLCVKYSC